MTSPTIGSNVEQVVYKNLHFLMWDIGGQDALRESWATYYAGARVRARACLVFLFLFLLLTHTKSRR